MGSGPETSLRLLELRDGLDPQPLPIPRQEAGRMDAQGAYRNPHCAAQSPDKRYLALVNQENNSDRVLLFDTWQDDFWQQPKRFAQGNTAYYGVALSQTRLALFGEGVPFLQLLDRQSMQVIPDFDAQMNGYCLAAAFSPDGQYLAALVGRGSGVRLRRYDLTASGFPYTQSAQTVYSYERCFLDYSPDGQYLVWAYASSEAPRYWNAQSLEWVSFLNQNNIRNQGYHCTCRAFVGDTLYLGYLNANVPVARVTLGDDYQYTPLPALNSADGEVALNAGVLDMVYDAAAQRMWVWHTLARSQGARDFAVLSWFDPNEDAPVMHPVGSETWPFPLLAKYHSDYGNGRMLLLQRGLGEVRGTVRDVDNAPAARVVRAYARQSGRLLAQTVSDAATGDYKMTLPDTQPVDVQFQAADGELLNDLLYARVIPDTP